MSKRQICLLAALAAAAFPASAGAAVTASTSGNTATLTSNDASDIIVLSVDGDGNLVYTVTSPPAAPTTSKDWDTSSPGSEEKVAAAGTTITVNGGGGDDSVNATPIGTAAESLVFDGGTGNDLVLGTDDADQLKGGDGDDRVVGNRGGDDMEGGAGNDLLVWNNGDGSDVMDGEAGNDGVEVNGAPTQGDQFVVRPGATAPRVAFDRTNLILFALDIGTTERLEVNGLGGEDTITGESGLAPLILLTLRGGAGRDTVTGGDGHDLLQGGEDVDMLSGGGGDDRVIGDRGDDTMAGGDGDDTLVWNNGDNTDKADGDAGYDVVEVNGAPGAGDRIVVRPNGARAEFDRTNLVPFNISIAAEVLDLNTLGGDDALDVADGTPLIVDADGGAGSDALAGADGHDSLLGGSGNDTLTGGRGLDALDGAEGDDTILARDGDFDVVRCGAGTDRATVDREDRGTACETADAPPAPEAAKPPALVVRSVRRSGSRLRATLECRDAPCKGRVTFLTARRVRLGRVIAVVQLGERAYDVPTGARRTISVRVPRGFRALSGRRRTLRIRAIARTDGAPTATRTAKVRTR